jgi:protein phosphatase
VDRIAIISDIHGNLTALETVLDDIKRRGIKRIFCLGDVIGKGSHPHECLELVTKNCEVTIMGNTDDYFANVVKIDNPDDIIGQERINWNKSLLEKSDYDKFSKFIFSYEFYMSGSLIRLFHASPISVYNEDAIYFGDYKNKIKLFKPTNKTVSKNMADIIIFGHVHIPFMERFYNHTLVNAGSVGNSIDHFRDDKLDANKMEITQASYIIIEGIYGSKEYGESFSVQFIRLPYDIEKELSESKNNPEMDKYILELRDGYYRNPNKVKEIIDKLT